MGDTMEQEKSLEQFIQEQGIVMQANPVEDNPNAVGFGPDANHWHVRFFAVKKESSEGFSTYFSQGSALTEPPTAADVLDCLASDAAGGDGRGFEEWASEYGYDTGSRSAEKTYRTIKAQSDQMREWLGVEAYEELLWSTERL